MSQIPGLHNIFSASQYNRRNITCLFLYSEHSSSSHVSFKDFSLSGLSPMTNTSYRWRSARYPASSSSSSSLARRWRRVGLMGAPCSADPLPRLALAWRKAVAWLLVKVGVQKTPEGCQENSLNLISMAFWAILWFVHQWKISSDLLHNASRGELSCPALPCHENLVLLLRPSKCAMPDNICVLCSICIGHFKYDDLNKC